VAIPKLVAHSSHINIKKKVENKRQGMREKVWMKEKNQIKEKTTTQV
jgi:hypothetical protein